MPSDDLRIPAGLRDRAQQIIDITDAACREHLDEEYGLITEKARGAAGGQAALPDRAW